MNILSTIGLASIISIAVSSIFDILNKRHISKYEKLLLEKENRYRSILVFMSVILDEENYIHINTDYKPLNPESIKDYYFKEVKLHLKFATLYASKSVINAIKNFLSNPIENNYDKVATAMRKDLWNKK